MTQIHSHQVAMPITTFSKKLRLLKLTPSNPTVYTAVSGTSRSNKTSRGKSVRRSILHRINRQTLLRQPPRFGKSSALLRGRRTYPPAGTKTRYSATSRSRGTSSSVAKGRPKYKSSQTRTQASTYSRNPTSLLWKRSPNVFQNWRNKYNAWKKK